MSPTTYAGLQLELRGHTAVLTLANPPANTWTAQSLAALTQLVSDLNARRDIYSLVVTGQGEKFFGRRRPKTVCRRRQGRGTRNGAPLRRSV
ncbi:hypothetical protein LP416_15215 [Polaromonas sp. P2-4]|nr:hypothetical protein LP416_15215 [Polaromonas sp. P2-4]